MFSIPQTADVQFHTYSNVNLQATILNKRNAQENVQDAKSSFKILHSKREYQIMHIGLLQVSLSAKASIYI